MNLEYYKNFKVIVETGSLAAAAKELHIAQSALSTQVKAFEEKFGTKLIIARRGVRQIQLTDAGKIFYVKAQYICKLDELALQEVDALSSGKEGTLRLSLSPSMSLEVIDDYLSGFCKLYPKVRYELYEVSIVELEKHLLAGLSEIGIARAPLLQPNEFNIISEAYDYLMAIYPCQNPWIPFKNDHTLSLAELQDVPLNLSRGCLAAFKAFCEEKSFEPNIQSVNTTKTSTIIWARQGAGVAIVPVSKEESYGSFLCSKFIEGKHLRVKKTIITPKSYELSPVAKLFFDYCSTLDLNWQRTIKGKESLLKGKA